MASPLEYREAVAARIKEAREAADYTQDDIAELLQIAQPAYSKYETRSKEGPTQMPYDVMARFALICRVSTDWLLNARGDGPRKPGIPQRPTRRLRSETA